LQASSYRKKNIRFSCTQKLNRFDAAISKKTRQEKQDKFVIAILSFLIKEL